MKIMITKRRLARFLGVLVVLCLVGSLGTPVLAVPEMNHTFYGDVTSEEGPLSEQVLAEGVLVEAKINGELRASTTVGLDSRYGWQSPYFKVLAEEASAGDPIEFYVNGVKAALYDVKTGVWLESESYPFEIGGYTELNLEADITPPTAPNADLITVNQNPPETLDSILGLAGAVEASSTVEVWDDEVAREEVNLVDSATANEDGSFAPIDIGNNLYAAVWITAKDATGNRSDATEMTNDIVAPAVTIDIPGINAANEASVPVTITSDEDGTYTYTISDSVIQLTDTDAITADVPVVLGLDLSTLADGAITANASVEDAAGNTGDATQDTATKDTVAPVVDITSPLEGALLNSLDVTIEGTATEVAEVVVDGLTAPVVDGAFSIVLTLSEGPNSVTATATDTAGNEGSDTVDFTIDVTPPAVTIDSVTTPTNTATKTLTGTRSAGLTVVLTSDEATVGAVTYPTDPTWSCDVTLVEGSNVITATADTSTATATIVLDTAAPTVVSKSPVAGAPGVAVGTTVSVTFSKAMDESTISTSSFTLDSVSGSVSYSSGTYTATFTPSDNLTLDTTYTATLSTAITDAVGNPLDEAYSWSFTTAKASLGDLIDEILAAGEDTLALPAGTYSGDITINEPITITGSTEGETIISGGITIGELTGSEVIIENLTIIDYTDFGIRIVWVKDVDNFTIRNNTIDGAEGNVIGIQVDKVDAGGILNIEQNTISGNETGIKLLADVVEAAIEFNNIDGNEVGLEQLAVGSNAGVDYNWWGDISGPEEENENPGGIGDPVVGDIGYYPWLTREFQTVLDDNIAYFGYPWVWLNTGWNIMSTPIALDPACDTWGEYVALGDGLDIHTTSPAWRFDALNQGWELLSADDALGPCDAIYVRMASDDIAAILLSPDRSVPSKELYSGWNLISLAWIEGAGMPANEALVTVEQVTGDLTGYKLVVSPGMSTYENSWIYIAGGDIGPWTDPNDWPPPDGWMIQSSGYWVFMLNDGTLAGFTFTPISLWE